MNIASGAAETDVLMSTGARKQKHVHRRTRWRCLWRYRDVSVHSLLVVQTCCGLVSYRRIYDSFRRSSACYSSTSTAKQDVSGDLYGDSPSPVELSAALRGVVVYGGSGTSEPSVRSMCVLLIAICCLLLSAVLCCATFRPCTACASVGGSSRTANNLRGSDGRSK